MFESNGVRYRPSLTQKDLRSVQNNGNCGE